MQLEENPDNSGIIDSIFRIMHNLKGNAGMFGFEKVQNLTHEFESLYDSIRTGKLKITGEIIGITLKGKDLLQAMLDNSYSGDEDVLLAGYAETNSFQGKLQPPETSAEFSDENTKNYAILFSPDRNIFERGLDPDKVLAGN